MSVVSGGGGVFDIGRPPRTYNQKYIRCVNGLPTPKLNFNIKLKHTPLNMYDYALELFLYKVVFKLKQFAIKTKKT